MAKEKNRGIEIEGYERITTEGSGVKLYYDDDGRVIGQDVEGIHLKRVVVVSFEGNIEFGPMAEEVTVSHMGLWIGDSFFDDILQLYSVDGHTNKTNIPLSLFLDHKEKPPLSFSLHIKQPESMDLLHEVSDDKYERFVVTDYETELAWKPQGTAPGLPTDEVRRAIRKAWQHLISGRGKHSQAFYGLIAKVLSGLIQKELLDQMEDDDGIPTAAILAANLSTDKIAEIFKRDILPDLQDRIGPPSSDGHVLARPTTDSKDKLNG